MPNLFKSFFKKEESSLNLELISIHIPKTAGTSFRKILEQVYSKKSVVQIDYKNHQGKIKVNNQDYSSSILPNGTQVIHGHFSILVLRKYFEIQNEIPIITWLRDPVDRVISNYYYLGKQLESGFKKEGNKMLIKRMQKSLLEFASHENNQNRQHRFLEGLELTDLSFVGVLEHFNEDLNALAKHLEWSNYKKLQVNVTGSKPQVSQEDREEIARLNHKDILLYEKALELRKKRNAQ